jgi:hypothetical protein
MTNLNLKNFAENEEDSQDELSNNEGTWNSIKRFFGRVKIIEIKLPDFKEEKLPNLEIQISNLELFSAKLARKGCDVSEESKMLDSLQAEQHPITVNEKLNRVRYLLFYAQKRLWFSQTIYPYILLFFEFVVIGLWAWLILAHSERYMALLGIETWPLLQLIYISVMSGSIGAAAFAIFGIYSHLIYRNMDRGFTAWYIARQLVGGIMGAFVGMIGSVALASGSGAHIVVMGIAFLAGSNEKFAAKMIDKFTTKVLGEAPKTANQVVIGVNGASPKETEAAKRQEQASVLDQKVQTIQENDEDKNKDITPEAPESKV